MLNAINDQVAGIGGVVITGTMRDSPHVLDVILAGTAARRRR